MKWGWQKKKKKKKKTVNTHNDQAGSIVMCPKDADRMTNRVDPDQIVPSHLDLHCLPG